MFQKRYIPRTMISRISADCDFANTRMNDDYESVSEYLIYLQYLRDHFVDYDDTIDEIMYKEKIFEDLLNEYHVLEISVKINDDDVLFKKIKNHCAEITCVAR